MSVVLASSLEYLALEFFGVYILLEATHHWETQENLLDQRGFWFPSKEVFLCSG